MATHILTPSRWSAKHITLAATIILTAVAIAATVSISLSPAHIRFSITDAKVNDLDRKGHDASYNFTIMVENRSWHTKVHFAALSIEISYGQTGWVPAEVDTSAWVHPRHKNNISASAGYFQFTEGAPPTPPAAPVTPTNTTETPPSPPPATTTIMHPGGECKVELIALVWFKFGLATTRPYNVRTSCSPVNFFGNSTDIVECIP